MVLHRGARVEGADYFDDHGTGSSNEGGVFKGLGHDNFESVHEELQQEGLALRYPCHVCGQDMPLVVDWEELFVIGTNGPNVAPLLPQGWVYSANNAACYPGQVQGLNCRKCSSPPGVMLTPDECREYVNQALGQGLIDRNQLAQWQQKAQLYRQR